MTRVFPLLLLFACGADDSFGDLSGPCVHPPPESPVCGSGVTSGFHLLPGPSETGWDAPLAERMRRLDRQAVVLSGGKLHVASVLSLQQGEDTAAMDAIQAFLEADGWAVQDPALLALLDTVTRLPATGDIAGPGIAADAFRYGVLRDEGADCDELAVAYEQLLSALDTLHMVTEITGVDGVLAAAVVRTDHPTTETLELIDQFDGAGDPLPYNKTEGVWRKDASGLYPHVVWKDGAGAAELVGWVTAMAAAWEVMRGDPAFRDEFRLRLRRDVRELSVALSAQDEGGFDLAVRDAGGRVLPSGMLHERAVNGAYGDEIGPTNPLISLGVASALAVMAEDWDVDLWLEEELVAERDLPEHVAAGVSVLGSGPSADHGALNLAWSGAWLAQRHLCDADARLAVAGGMASLNAPAGQAWSDLVYASQFADVTGWSSEDRFPDALSLETALLVLEHAPSAPIWDVPVENCDVAEVEAGMCLLNDGGEVSLLGGLGTNGELLADTPIPMSVRPRSDWYWAANPYAPNGAGTGRNLLPGADLRLVYWAGRWAKH